MRSSATKAVAKVHPAIRRNQAAQPPVAAGTSMPLASGYDILRQIKKGGA